jgi:uncharacterized RDD family membrane protein YckC
VSWALPSVAGNLDPGSGEARTLDVVDDTGPDEGKAGAQTERELPTNEDAAWSAWERQSVGATDHALDDLTFLRSASPWLRLAGATIDGVIIIVIGVLIASVAPNPAWLTTAVYACYVVGFVAVLGQTLGNMAVGTRVELMGRDGAPGFLAALVRYAVPGAILIVALFWPPAAALEAVWLLCVYAPILAGPSHRGLHDRAAGVFVSDDRLAA